MTTHANHILLIAHAPLGQALYACAEHVFADCRDYVSVLDVLADESPEHTLQRGRAMLDSSGAARTLVMADVVGATPSNVAQRLVDGNAAQLLVGVNLPMLLRAICYRHEPLAVLVDKALAGGQQGMLHMGSSAPQKQSTRNQNAQDTDHHQQ